MLPPATTIHPTQPIAAYSIPVLREKQPHACAICLALIVRKAYYSTRGEDSTIHPHTGLMNILKP